MASCCYCSAAVLTAASCAAARAAAVSVNLLVLGWGAMLFSLSGAMGLRARDHGYLST